MRLSFATVAAAAFVAPCAPAAWAQPAQAGDLWDITVQMEMAGMPMALPPRTTRSCAPRSRAEPPFKGGREDCRITEQKSTGAGWTWKMVCNDGTSGDGTISYQGMESWNGEMNMRMKDGAARMKMSGKRAGSCDYKAPAVPQLPK